MMRNPPGSLLTLNEFLKAGDESAMPLPSFLGLLTLNFWGINEMGVPEGPNLKAPEGSKFPLEPFCFLIQRCSQADFLPLGY
jgi:hypothetical protein